MEGDNVPSILQDRQDMRLCMERGGPTTSTPGITKGYKGGAAAGRLAHRTLLQRESQVRFEMPAEIPVGHEIFV